MSTSKKGSSHKSPKSLKPDATDRSLDNLLYTLKTQKVNEASQLERVQEEQVEVRSESFIEDYPQPPEPIERKSQTP